MFKIIVAKLWTDYLRKFAINT